MIGSDIMARAMLGLVTAGAAAVASLPVGVRADDDGELRKELQALATRTVLFGHQSVGTNLLDGVVRLAAGAGVKLRIEDVSKTFVVRPGNGNPGLKLESFGRVLAANPPGSVDAALVKFCFVDFSADTDALALFARYQEAVARFRSVQPRATMVHVTTPLTTVPGGPKVWVQRMLGKVPYGVRENARRQEFNALIRAAYQGKEPIFDLALVESTRPDGSRETVEWQGRTIPLLAGVYTDDGGHLNEAGQAVAARALVSVLARTPSDAAPPTPSQDHR
jgi:hypothetical protein